MIYKIFTVSSGFVELGANVGEFTLASGNASFPAVMVGEEGRGRAKGVINVHLTEAYELWKEKKNITLSYCTLEKTRTGRPKLVEVPNVGDYLGNMCLIVFRTKIGFRGGNNHTGDLVEGQYLPFPGEVLVAGRIAQGMAGGMGSGEQLIAIMPKNVVFRTCYSGRLYGADNQHFYKFDGESIVAVTQQERDLTNII